MGAGGAFFADADFAEGQVDVVVDDGEVFEGDFVVMEGFLDGFAGEVHEG